MNGKRLAIGMVLFIIAGIVVIYFAVNATFNSDRNSMESMIEVIANEPWAE